MLVRLIFFLEFCETGEGGGEMEGDCNCKLLSLGLLQLFSCKNAILSKYLHFGKEDAAAPALVMLERFSKHFFKLSLKFLVVSGITQL